MLDTQLILRNQLNQPTMSTRFVIKNTASKAEKEGDTFLRFTGVSEPFIHVSERKSEQIGVDSSGAPKLKFLTGLEENIVKFYTWYNEEEQKEVLKQIKELRPIIADYYGGESAIAADNKYFWGENREVNRISISNEDVDQFFETTNPVHALLYLSIISGAFMEVVAPTKELAERNHSPHYLSLETDNTYDDEDDITRSDAHSMLSELRKEADPEALFILAWCLQYDTSAFGGINRATPVKNLINTHIQFIDGKLQMKKKRNTPATFIEYAKRWQGQQTRPALYAEAYIKAGEYFNFVNQKDKKYVTIEGTALGNTIPDAVQTIMKNKYTQDLENLREKVEAKWKE